MKILFAIALLSFCLLLWAAVAITRHIRRGQFEPLPLDSIERAPEAAVQDRAYKPVDIPRKDARAAPPARYASGPTPLQYRQERRAGEDRRQSLR
jgi:hypothetical protein